MRVTNSMVHITCDICGRSLPAGDDRYVLKIEVFASHDPAELTEADLDADHMDEVSQLLSDLEVESEAEALAPTTQQFKYDLCSECRKRYVRDPLSKDAVPKLHFSKN